MLCALTVRRLKPGTFEDFRSAFMAPLRADETPEGFVHFTMLRNAADPDEVVCFGTFDGTLDDLRRESGGDMRESQLTAIAPFVESVGADGLYEVVEDVVPASA